MLYQNLFLLTTKWYKKYGRGPVKYTYIHELVIKISHQGVRPLQQLKDLENIECHFYSFYAQKILFGMEINKLAHLIIVVLFQMI